MTMRIRFALSTLSLGLVPQLATAHHSVAGFFDPSTSIEIEGVITKVRWRNPHTVFIVDTIDASGKVVTWSIESGALGVLRSRGLAREFVKVGDQVKIMGDASIRSATEMFARNMLLGSGKEVMLTAGSRPYFSVDSNAGLLEAEFDAEVVAAAKANADGVFRVWSTNIDRGPRRSSGSRMFTGRYPMNDAAKAVRQKYDAGDVTLLGCTEWAMPRIMSNPLPMEFVQEGNTVLQRFEEDDNVRVIHMDENAAAPEGHSLMGFSTGLWDGQTLVIETTNIRADRLDNFGTPTSSALHLLERYTPSADDSRLDYTITVTDPNTFLEPFELNRNWEWRPEMVVGTYNCEQDQQLR